MSPISVSEFRSVNSNLPRFFFFFFLSYMTFETPSSFCSSSLFRFSPSPLASHLIYSSVSGIPFFSQMSQISSSVNPKLLPFRNASNSSFVNFPLFLGSLRISLISSFVNGTPFSFFPNSFAISASVNLMPFC